MRLGRSLVLIVLLLAGVLAGSPLGAAGEPGQPGVGARAPRPTTPTPAPTPTAGDVADHDWVDLSTSGDHACAVATDGATLCWGRSQSNNDLVVRAADAPVTAIETARQTCTITLAQDLDCWVPS